MESPIFVYLKKIERALQYQLEAIGCIPMLLIDVCSNESFIDPDTMCSYAGRGENFAMTLIMNYL